MNFKNYAKLKRPNLSQYILLTLPLAVAVALPVQARELEEVVVTARKRSENLIDVPMSVSAFSGDTIEKLGITDIEDTYGSVPGLYFTGNALSPNRDFRQLVIRGVGANSQLEPSVATFIDGVYSPALAFDLDFLDLERVEILKGPQGSLFGRNTEGGALNIVSREADGEFRGKAAVMLDDFSTRQIALGLNGALSEEHHLYAKLNVLYNQTDGYIKNASARDIDAANILVEATNILVPRQFDHSSRSRSNQDEGEKRAISLGFLWQASDDLTLSLNLDYSDYEGGDPAPGPLAGSKSYRVDSDLLFDQESENTGGSFKVDWQLDNMVFTSITGWRDMEASTPWDFDGVTEINGFSRVNNVHDYDSEQAIFSEELRLASDSDAALSWLVGAYYFEETNNADRFYNFPNLDNADGSGSQQFLDGLWNQQIVNIDRTGYAFFGQLIYRVNDDIELALGARYSKEEAKVEALEAYCFPFTGFNSSAGTGIPGPNSGLDTFCSVDQGDWQDFITPVKDKQDWSNFSPSFTAKYYLAEDVMTYFSYAEGFKAGSYQKAPVTVADVVPIDPEELKNYELGFKASFLDNRLTLNTAIYQIDLKDMQLQGVVIRNGITASSIGNAASAQVRGLEFSMQSYLTESLSLNLNYSRINSEFKDYQIEPTPGNRVDRSGARFPNTPETSYAISFEHRYDINSNFELLTNLSYRYVDDIYIGSNATAADTILEIDSWRQIDLRVSLITSDWKLSLFANNLTDEYIVLSKWNPFFVEPNLSVVHDRVAPPRRIGINLTYEF